VEERKCKSPILKDVASADGIHWYADTVITLVRDVIYDPGTEHPEFAQVSVLKSFYGLMGGFQLVLNQPSGYFSEIQQPPL
jgi:replicative DNA helicase